MKRGSKTALRINLVSGTENRNIMSWRFREDPDIFHEKLYDFVLDLSTSVVSEIQIAEAGAAHLWPDGASDGYAIIQSTEMQRTYYSEQRAHDIIDHLTELVHREPENAAARAALAVQLASNVVSQWAKDPADFVAQATSHLSLALKLAPTDAEVIGSAGIAIGMLNQREQAIRYLTRARELNPSDPNTLAALGLQLALTGKPEEGLDCVVTAERRAPHHPRRCLWIYYRASCYVVLEHSKEAAEAYLQCAELNPNWHMPSISAANCLAMQGRDEEARIALKAGIASQSDYTLDDYIGYLRNVPGVYRNEETLLEWVAGMRRIWPGEA